jgi:hypothetical protein
VNSEQKNRLFFDPALTAARHAARDAGAKAVSDKLRQANAAKHAEATAGREDFAARRHADLERRHAAGESLRYDERLALANGRTAGLGRPEKARASADSTDTLARIATLNALLPQLTGADLAFAEGQLSLLRGELGIGTGDA